MTARHVFRGVVVALLTVVGLAADASAQCQTSNPEAVYHIGPLRVAGLNQDDRIAPGEVLTIRNVWFEGGGPAMVLVLGDDNGDLDLWVNDGLTDRLIGEDVSYSSNGRVIWTPWRTGPVTIRVANVGVGTERFRVLVNW